MIKHKFFLPLVVFSAFLIGVVFGNKLHFASCNSKKKTKIVLFDNPKYLNQKITEQESRLLEKIVKPTIQKCVNELDDAERILLSAVIEKLSYNFKENKAEVDLVKDLNFTNKEIKSSQKFKKCLFQVKKFLSKEEVRALKFGIKKTSVKETLAMFRVKK